VLHKEHAAAAAKPGLNHNPADSAAPMPQLMPQCNRSRRKLVWDCADKFRNNGFTDTAVVPQVFVRGISSAGTADCHG